MRTDFVNMESGDKKKLGRGNNEVKGTLHDCVMETN